MMDAQHPDAIFESFRPLLFSIAYRMLGDVMQAEDTVQDAYLRWREVPLESIQSPKAFLSAVVTRLCLDHLKSARQQREIYIGPWLPEPILTADTSVPLTPIADQYDSLSMAVMVLLESLTPPERAVFVLRAVFDYEYAEIAEMLGKDEAACRQLFSRARKFIMAHQQRFKPTPEKRAQILGQFLVALNDGDLDGLTHLLTEDVVWTSDGGGKVTAARRPIIGREAVARFIMGLRKQADASYSLDIAEINGDIGLILRRNGTPRYTIAFQLTDTQIHAVYAVANPDKLRHVR